MKNIFIILLLSLSMLTFSQEKYTHLNDGNEKFDQKKYAEAEVDYRISQAKAAKKPNQAII